MYVYYIFYYCLGLTICWFDEDNHDVEDDGTAPSRMLNPDLEESESESDDDLDSLVLNMVPGSEDAEELRKVICALLKVFFSGYPYMYT